MALERTAADPASDVVIFPPQLHRENITVVACRVARHHILAPEVLHTKILGRWHVRRIARTAGGSDGATPAVVARILRRQSVGGKLICGQTQGGAVQQKVGQGRGPWRPSACLARSLEAALTQ